MIKVTLGEKPKEEKPFPKLMKGDDGLLIEVLQQPDEKGEADVVVRAPHFSYVRFFRVFNGAEKFTDYNEPITIQNA